MKFTKTHEWIETEGDIGTVGVTDHAQNQLGDIVYVELPKIDSHVKAGDEIAVLESTKAAADVYSPVSGQVVAVNEELTKNAGLINTSAEGQGWIFKVRLDNLKELDELMDLVNYQKG